MEIIKSISYDQDEIITNIMKLFNIEQFDIDCTYSSGNFYKNIIQPKFKFDLNPQTKDTIRADCRNLPLKNNNINSSMLDLPFVIGGANFREAKDGSCVIGKRFSSFTSWNQLKELYSNAIKKQYHARKYHCFMIVLQKCKCKVNYDL